MLLMSFLKTISSSWCRCFIYNEGFVVAINIVHLFFTISSEVDDPAEYNTKVTTFATVWMQIMALVHKIAKLANNAGLPLVDNLLQWCKLKLHLINL